VGLLDGLFVGALDGFLDGLEVGLLDGFLVGFTEGNNVGFKDGFLDGLLVGFAVDSTEHLKNTLVTRASVAVPPKPLTSIPTGHVKVDIDENAL